MPSRFASLSAAFCLLFTTVGGLTPFAAHAAVIEVEKTEGVDDDDKLRRAIHYAQPGDTVLLPNRSMRLHQTHSLKRDGFVVKGQAKTVLILDENVEIVIATNDVTLQDVSLVGSGRRIIFIGGDARRATVKNCTIVHDAEVANNDAITVGRIKGAREHTGHVIENCSIVFSDSGITVLDSAEGVTIRGCQFIGRYGSRPVPQDDLRGTGVYIFASRTTVEDSEFFGEDPSRQLCLNRAIIAQGRRSLEGGVIRGNHIHSIGARGDMGSDLNAGEQILLHGYSEHENRNVAGHVFAQSPDGATLTVSSNTDLTWIDPGGSYLVVHSGPHAGQFRRITSVDRGNHRLVLDSPLPALPPNTAILPTNLFVDWTIEDNVIDGWAGAKPDRFRKTVGIYLYHGTARCVIRNNDIRRVGYGIAVSSFVYGPSIENVVEGNRVRDTVPVDFKVAHISPESAEIWSVVNYSIGWQRELIHQGRYMAIRNRYANNDVNPKKVHRGWRGKALAIRGVGVLGTSLLGTDTWVNNGIKRP